MVHNLTTRTAGTARHLIITTEQLFKSKTGHLSRLCRLLYDTRFQKRIDRVNVDEVHFIYFAGTEHYGLDAFRPAWGRLKEIKAILPSRIPWHGLTATCPPHVERVIKKSILRDGYSVTRLTSNRPNTIYAARLTKLSAALMFSITINAFYDSRIQHLSLVSSCFSISHL